MSAFALAIISIVLNFVTAFAFVSERDNEKKRLEKLEMKINESIQILDNRMDDLEGFKKDLSSEIGIEVETDYSSLSHYLSSLSYKSSLSYRASKWRALLKYLGIEWQEKEVKGFFKKSNKK